MTSKVFFAALLAGLFSIASAAQTTPPGKHPKASAVKAASASPQPTPAVVYTPPPPTPEQMPASPPQVSYQNGQLTITANNSTLDSILAAVRQQTGAQLEVNGGGAERVVAHLGPAAPRDVLAALLNGSRFDYVMLGGENSSGPLQHVILTARQGGTAVASGGPAQPQQPMPQAYQPPPQVPAPVEEDQADAPEQEENPPAMAQPEQPQPGVMPQGAIPAQQQSGVNQPGQPPQQGEQEAPKTPEQLLQELQRMQMQQQQLRQQQTQQETTPRDE